MEVSFNFLNFLLLEKKNVLVSCVLASIHNNLGIITICHPCINEYIINLL